MYQYGLYNMFAQGFKITFYYNESSYFYYYASLWDKISKWWVQLLLSFLYNDARSPFLGFYT